MNLRRSAHHFVRAAIAVSVLALWPCRAHAEAGSLVRVRAENIFGNDALSTVGYTTLVVSAESTAKRHFEGILEVETENEVGGPDRFVHPLSLSDTTEHSTLITLFPGSGSIRARFRSKSGEVLGSTSITPTAERASVVVMSDRREHVTWLRGLKAPHEQHSYLRWQPVPIGEVRVDRVTQDLVLPETAIGWSQVAVLLTTSRTLATLSTHELQPIGRWLHGGGTVIILTDRDAHHSSPLIDDHVGSLRWGKGQATTYGSSQATKCWPYENDEQIYDHFCPMVPSTSDGRWLECAEGLTAESFGCSKRVGFGRVFITATDDWSQELLPDLVRSVLVDGYRESQNSIEPLLGHGRVKPTDMGGALKVSRSLWSHFTGETTYARSTILRDALDCNFDFRIDIVNLTIVLALYVLTVCPLNLWLARRHRKPGLLLLSTPLFASICACLLLAVGVWSKGIESRFSSAELVEVVGGSQLASARRYSGVFPTSELTFDMVGPQGGGLNVRQVVANRRGWHSFKGRRFLSSFPLVDTQTEVEPSILHTKGGKINASDIKGSRWKTIFLREDRLIDLGGELLLELDEVRLPRAVVNNTLETLRDAYIVGSADEYALIGDIPTGRRAVVGPLKRGFPTNPFTLLGLSGKQIELAAGLVNGPLSDQPSTFIIWSRLDPERDAPLAQHFKRDVQVRLMRVVVPYGEVWPVHLVLEEPESRDEARDH